MLLGVKTSGVKATQKQRGGENVYFLQHKIINGGKYDSLPATFMYLEALKMK